MSDIQIHDSWLKHLLPEFEKPYMQRLKQFLQQEKAQQRTIYPPSDKIFEALNTTPLDNIKVVILGQDSYHGEGQAHGLCFSVQPGIAVPPSLVNIYKELHDDVAMPIPQHGYLKSWAEQGVFLLNSTLTVAMNCAGSHQNKGWETFTDTIIQLISSQCDSVVFLLWGKFAQSKSALIDDAKHLILTAPHPSPLSAYRGFLGCKHFSKTNDFLQIKGLNSINWSSLVN